MPYLLLTPTKTKEKKKTSKLCPAKNATFLSILEFTRILLETKIKIRFTQKIVVKWPKCLSSEPFFVPGEGRKFKLMNDTDKMLIFLFFCSSQINL